MLAVFFDKNLSLRDLPVPIPGRSEALVRVTLAGICNTDLEICRGYMAFTGILGHEFVGIVENSPVTEQVGMRVVGEINVGCGICPWCLSGMARHCPDRTVLGIYNRQGAFAEYLTLPARNLLHVPQNVSDEAAVFTEPLAAALEILDQVKISPVSRVLVIGDGKLGLLIASVLRLNGCNLKLVGKHPDKLEYFKKIGGETILLEHLEQDHEVFDVVVEASGNASGWNLAVKRIKPRGTIVLKSTYHDSMEFNPASLVVNEIKVVGSRCGMFEPALRMLSQGTVDPTPLIDSVFRLDQADRAFERCRQKGSKKILLKT
jgi:threonine dehydrogenase-like Zn-dependent dehydrogenase